MFQQQNGYCGVMETDQDNILTEIRLTHCYIKDHPWVVTAVSGFLSAYFMEQPSFRVQRHFDEPESGMHVWRCEVPGTMKMSRLLRRLQADIPPCRYSLVETETTPHSRYVIDIPSDD